MNKHKLLITKLADQDLNDLYSEGFRTWGEEQADRYYDGLLNRLESICKTHLMYPAVDDIQDGYRRSVYEKHSIYFVVQGSVVEVRAIVKRQNISSRL